MKAKQFLTLGLALVAMTVSATSHAQSLLEKIATTVLADQFGIDTREVVVLHERTNLPIYELAPIYETAHYSKATPSSVWTLRNQGLGWGQVAQRLGMHPGTFNKLRNQGAFDRDRFWTKTYGDRFGASNQQITVLRKGGGSLEDILGAIVVGKLTNKDPQTVCNQFQTQQNWTKVTNNYNVRFEDWKKVSKPVKTVYYVPKSTGSVGKLKSNSGVGKSKSGKGVGSGSSKSKGGGGVAKGNSGKGSSKGKGGLAKGKSGGGNSKAKGGGNGKGGGKGKGGV